MPGTVVVNQPGVYLVDVDGNVVTANDGTTIASHEGLLVAGKDGTVLRFMRVAADGTLRIDPTGTTTQPISAASLPLPTGAATEAKLEAVRVLIASLDGKDYATQTTLATLATEAKLEAVRVLLASLDGKDYATQTTLVAANTKLDTIDAVLDSIKDTDGIKKITDPLPAGTNTLGKADQGVSADFADAWAVKSAGVLSADNSTTTPLGAGAVFTGASEEVLHYANATVYIDTDQPSAVKGVEVQFSTDSVNWATTAEYAFLVPPVHLSVPPRARYFRLRYTNGATPQTYFRLQTIWHYFRTKPSSLSLQQPINEDNDAELVRSILSAKKPNGQWDNVAIDANGNLKVSVAAEAATALPFIINLNYEATDGAINTSEYKRVVQYTAPAGYDGWLIRFSSYQNESAKSRFVAIKEMGTLDFVTDVFTAGAAYHAPQASSVVAAEVTTAVGSGGANTKVVTVTYTNVGVLGAGQEPSIFPRVVLWALGSSSCCRPAT